MENLGNGGFVLTKPDEINAFRLLALKGRLKLETVGLKFSGASTFSMVKQETGLKARTAKDLLPLFENWLRERGILR